MRKAFTLIELMITILLMTIFLNFVFRFYSNVLMELRYLEAKDSLTYSAFRVSQIIKNGVYANGGHYIGGVVTLEQNLSSSKFKTYLDTTTIDTTNGILTISDSSNLYKFQDLNITDFNLSQVGNNGLYVFEFNATKESIMKSSELNITDITRYQRLVYTK